VLSVAKLRVGQEAYQLSGVARSLDDYYTGSGEAPGRWSGEGAARLGLAGVVEPDDLRAVLAGLAPGSGGLSPNGEQVRVHPRRVPGFDLTFKVPKSVSVLYAVSDDPRVQGAIIEAGNHAVRETIGWLEREVIRVRRGTGNERFLADLATRDPEAAAAARIRALPATGAVAAVFRHRTSRAGDPLLHWHTLVANLVEGPDGRWSAFVHPDLYRAARSVGEVFQTVLRAELTARLGLTWRPGRHVPEVAGVPQALCDVFSKRSKEIDAWLDATGTPADPAGRQRAALATRRHKGEVEGERFDLGWKAEALAHGWGPDAAEALVLDAARLRLRDDEVWRLVNTHDGNGNLVVGDQVVRQEEWVRELLRELTREHSTFGRPDLVRAVASRLGDGATVSTLEGILASVLASPELIPIGIGNSGRGDRWTSRELLTVEQRLAHAITDPVGTRVPIEPVLVATQLAARTTIGDDQEAAVRTLVGADTAVAVLVGPAGTGKTFTLDAVRAIYDAAGYRVVGVAPSARAALELESAAGIASSTMQRRLGEWSRGFDPPDDRTLLVIDEAGMAATRDLEPLVTATVQAGGRVVLAGDHHQLPEVTAGGGFAHAVSHARALAVLRVNRRQREPWERHALAELRDQHVATAVHAYREHGRIVVADSRGEMIGAAVDHWFAARTEGKEAVLLAGTNQMVDALNQAVRGQLLERGLLTGAPVGQWAGRSFVVGDRVVLRSNSYQERTPEGAAIAVLNGQPGTVLSGNDASLVVRLDRDGRSVALAPSYLRHGWVDHGYALTSHRAQGGTWDLAIAVGTDGLHREGAYVQLSRGRESNWLVVTRAELDAADPELDRHDQGLPLPAEAPPDVEDDLVRRLTQSRAKLLALTHDPHAAIVDNLARSTSLTELENAARHARQVEHRVATRLQLDSAALRAASDRARHTAAHLATAQQVKAHDRHNIGTVTTIDDQAGTAIVAFQSPGGTTATRSLRWDELEIVSPRDPDPRAGSPVIDATLDRLLEPIATQLARWRDELAREGVHPLDAQHAARAARQLVDTDAARLVARDPAWLTDLLGERPRRALPAQVWDDAVRDIAAFRARRQIPDHVPGLDDHTTPHQTAHQTPSTSSATPPLSAWVADDGGGERTRLHARLDATNRWIQNYDLGPALPAVRNRSLPELAARHAELDALLAIAPPDQQRLLDGLRSEGRLPLEDSTTAISTALDTQDARRSWILAHWPHVVEYAEIHRALADHQAGSDTARMVEMLTGNERLALATAATKNEPWLHTLLAHTTPGAEFEPRLYDVLDQVAAYRQRWQVDHQSPLGLSASTLAQQVERTTLTAELVDLGIISVDDAVAGRGIDDRTREPRIAPVDDRGESLQLF
jgi:conjugative relaxase-like TrwC/TraI family protein